MADALDELGQIENRMNCKRLLEEIIESGPEYVVVFAGGEGEVPGYSYCGTPAVAISMVELCRTQMVLDVLHGTSECECECE